MISIFILLFLLIFMILFVTERYYFYKIFCPKIDENTTRVLSGLPTEEYKPFNT